MFLFFPFPSFFFSFSFQQKKKNKRRKKHTLVHPHFLALVCFASFVLRFWQSYSAHVAIFLHRAVSVLVMCETSCRLRCFYDYCVMPVEGYERTASHLRSVDSYNSKLRSHVSTSWRLEMVRTHTKTRTSSTRTTTRKCISTFLIYITSHITIHYLLSSGVIILTHNIVRKPFEKVLHSPSLINSSSITTHPHYSLTTKLRNWAMAFQIYPYENKPNLENDQKGGITEPSDVLPIPGGRLLIMSKGPNNRKDFLPPLRRPSQDALYLQFLLSASATANSSSASPTASPFLDRDSLPIRPQLPNDRPTIDHSAIRRTQSYDEYTARRISSPPHIITSARSHPHRFNNRDPRRSSTSPSKPGKCPHCDVVLKWPNGLRKHVQVSQYNYSWQFCPIMVC